MIGAAIISQTMMGLVVGGGKVLSAEIQTTILEAGLEPATQRSPLESNPSCLGDPLGYITTMVW